MDRGESEKDELTLQTSPEGLGLGPPAINTATLHAAEPNIAHPLRFRVDGALALIALGSIYALMPQTTEGRGVEALVFGGVTVLPLVMLSALSRLHSETLLNVIVSGLWLLSAGLYPCSYFFDASTQGQGIFDSSPSSRCSLCFKLRSGGS